MDTSETHIKMCEKAKEIQDSNSAYGRHPDVVAEYGCTVNKFGDWFWHNIWLPRQDQLQEMVDPYKNELNSEWHSGIKVYDLLRVFVGFCSGDEYEMGFPTAYVEKFASMEQLWLAFVMKEKYNKVWNGEDWEDVD